MRWLIVVVLAMTGCIGSDLDTCDGWSCPNGRTCVMLDEHHFCASPDELSVCSGAAPLTECPLGDAQGVCVDGVCIPPRCGNQRVELTEECDDGNADAGDGCSPGCTSEVCGNGIIDASEGCDCGTTGTSMRPECSRHLNSDDDPLAPCRTNCTLRTCGDGVRDPSEQCDGASAIEASCETFGFYAGGELACTPICTFDTTACTGGRCGDSVLQTSEFCDPTVPGRLIATCTDFGYSTGALRCNDACGPDARECHPSYVLTPLAGAAPVPIDVLPGGANAAWIVSGNDLAYYASGGAMTHFPTAANVLDGSSSGSRVAVATDDAKVTIYDAQGAVMAFDAPFACTQIVMASATKLACLAGGDAAWWNGGVWGTTIHGPGVLPPTDAAYVQATGGVMYTDYAGLSPDLDPGSAVYLLDDTTLVAMSGATERVMQIDHTSDGYFGGVGYGANGYSTVTLTDVASGWQPFSALEMEFTHELGGLRLFLNGVFGVISPQEEVARVGAGSLFPRLTGSIDAIGTGCRRMVAVGAEGLCLTRERDRVLRFAGATAPTVEAAGQRDIFIDENDRGYFAGVNGSLAKWDGAWSGAVGTFDTIVGTSSTDIVVYGGTTVAHWDGASFTSVAVADQITAAAPDGQGGVVYAFEESNFADYCDVYAGPLDAGTSIFGGFVACPHRLWTSPSGHIWAATKYGDLLDLTGTTIASLALGIGKVGLTGIDDQHVWIAFKTKIGFWDGTQLTVQFEDPNAEFDWISARSTDLVIASSGPTTYIYDSSHTWTKLRLPSDFNGMIHPLLTSWGVYFLTLTGSVEFAAWQLGWP